MGGCRCVFQDCKISTSSSKKLFPGRDTHFFHFPIRDPDRCIEWAVYSNNMPLLELPLEKLKNKVICDLHFNENFFMNYKREKLNKTNAIPTIYLAEDNIEIDLLKNPEPWIEENRNKEIPASFSQVFGRDASQILDDSSINLGEQTVEPEPKKAKLDSTKNPVKILNIGANSYNVGSTHVKRVVQKLPTTSTPKMQVIKVSADKFKLREVKTTKVSPAKKETPSPRKEPEIFYDDVPVITQDEPQWVSVVHTEPVAQPSEELKTILIDSKQEIADIKEILSELRTQQASTSTARVKPETSNIVQSSMSKVQLYNGIKRYLNPAMNALLRMELFSTPSREFKADEKEICQELLTLGDKTYDFLTDIWRLRLPDKQNVLQWKEQAALQEDDDDAC